MTAKKMREKKEGTFDQQALQILLKSSPDIRQNLSIIEVSIITGILPILKSVSNVIRCPQV